MIWFLFLVVAALAVLPVVFTLWRSSTFRGRREAALALHRAQLVELETDHRFGRVGTNEYAEARLEIQRRILAAAEANDSPPAPSSRLSIFIALLLVPIAGLALYLPGGEPYMPAAPWAARVKAARAAISKDQQLISLIREKMAGIDPHSEQARTGYILLGNLESNIGNLKAALADWEKAQNIQFDPKLAATLDALKKQLKASQ